MNAMIESEHHGVGQSHDLLMPALALAWAPGRTSSWTHWPEWSRINSVTYIQHGTRLDGEFADFRYVTRLSILSKHLINSAAPNRLAADGQENVSNVESSAPETWDIEPGGQPLWVQDSSLPGLHRHRIALTLFTKKISVSGPYWLRDSSLSSQQC